jgi:hypothetical protein
VIFFKRRARQLFKTMFTLEDVHWIAATLNPRTRMLKHATDAERAHAHSLVRRELTKIMETEKSDDRSVEPLATDNSSPSLRKKLKSYTNQFDDDTDYSESEKLTATMRSRRELEIYLQMKLQKNPHEDVDATNEDNPLLFWKEQQHLLPNLSKLARKTFSVPASSAAVERTFSSAGVVLSQRRTSINPSTVNDIILIRSSTSCSQRVVKM